MSNEQEETTKKRRAPRTADDKLADALATAEKDLEKAAVKLKAAETAEAAAVVAYDAAEKTVARLKAAAGLES